MPRQCAHWLAMTELERITFCHSETSPQTGRGNPCPPTDAETPAFPPERSEATATVDAETDCISCGEHRRFRDRVGHGGKFADAGSAREVLRNDVSKRRFWVLLSLMTKVPRARGRETNPGEYGLPRGLRPLAMTKVKRIVICHS